MMSGHRWSDVDRRTVLLRQHRSEELRDDDSSVVVSEALWQLLLSKALVAPRNAAHALIWDPFADWVGNKEDQAADATCGSLSISVLSDKEDPVLSGPSTGKRVGHDSGIASGTAKNAEPPPLWLRTNTLLPTQTKASLHVLIFHVCGQDHVKSGNLLFPSLHLYARVCSYVDAYVQGALLRLLRRCPEEHLLRALSTLFALYFAQVNVICAVFQPINRGVAMAGLKPLRDVCVDLFRDTIISTARSRVVEQINARVDAIRAKVGAVQADEVDSHVDDDLRHTIAIFTRCQLWQGGGIIHIHGPLGATDTSTEREPHIFDDRILSQADNFYTNLCPSLAAVPLPQMLQRISDAARLEHRIFDEFLQVPHDFQIKRQDHFRQNVIERCQFDLFTLRKAEWRRLFGVIARFPTQSPQRSQWLRILSELFAWSDSVFSKLCEALQDAVKVEGEALVAIKQERVPEVHSLPAPHQRSLGPLLAPMRSLSQLHSKEGFDVVYVQELLHLYQRWSLVVSQGFGGHPLAEAALQRALSSVLHRNTGPITSTEMTAAFCHMVLQQCHQLQDQLQNAGFFGILGAVNDERYRTELELQRLTASLKLAARLLPLLPDTDAFKLCSEDFLCVRLLQLSFQTSSGFVAAQHIQTERQFLSFLRTSMDRAGALEETESKRAEHGNSHVTGGVMAGSRLVASMRHMLDDTETSGHLEQRFRTMLQETRAQFNSGDEAEEPMCFSVQVLAKGVWPVLRQWEDLQVPAVFGEQVASFVAFYASSGTKTHAQTITWLHHVGTAVLQCQSVELHVHALQAFVLVLFNDHEQLSLQDIATRLGIDPSLLSAVIHSLCYSRFPVLLRLSPPRKPFALEDGFQVNRPFFLQSAEVVHLPRPQLPKADGVLLVAPRSSLVPNQVVGVAPTQQRKKRKAPTASRTVKLSRKLMKNPQHRRHVMDAEIVRFVKRSSHPQTTADISQHVLSQLAAWKFEQSQVPERIEAMCDLDYIEEAPGGGYIFVT